MKRQYLLLTGSFLYLFIFFNKSFAQKRGQEKIDSLLNVLHQYKPACQQPCIGDSSKVRTLLITGREYIFRNRDSAITLNNEALQLARQINWQFGIAASYHSIAFAFEKTGDNDSALSYYLRALHIAEQMEVSGSKEEKTAIRISKSRALGNAGFIYINQGNYLAGLDLYFQSLKIENDLNNKPGISKDLILIGEVFDEQGESQKALDYDFKALAIERKLNDPNRLSALLGNIGVVYTSLQDYDKALQYYTEGLSAAKAFGDKSRIGAMLADVGEIYFKNADYKKAEAYLFRGLKLAEAASDKYTVSQIMNNIGKTYLQEKKYPDAKKYLSGGLALANLANDKNGTISLYQNLSELYLHEGNYKISLVYYKKAVLLKDTLFNEEKNKEITRKEMTYEFAKKRDSTKVIQNKKDAIAKQEIEKQKVIRNAIIAGTGGVGLLGLFGFRSFRNKRKREKAELSQQVAETEMKALRAQMNPHFIFNALQSIQTFLLTNQPKDANTYLLTFSQLIRLVLENSLHREVPLQKDRQALELYMQLESIRLTHPFTYSFHIDENIDEETATIPPLILQPFVENAIWHGLQPRTQPGGHIAIYIREQNSTLYCTVEDNGIGRNNRISVQSTPNTPKQSLGMKLTEERLKIINELKKIKACFTIVDLFSADHQPAGTKVELILPYTT